MNNLSIYSGSPSEHIKPTETENRVFYSAIGNRTKKIIHYKTIESLQAENINGLIQVSATARVGLGAFRNLDQTHQLYLIEREAEAKVTGNIRLSLNLQGKPDRLHNPFPFPGPEGGTDNIVLSLQPTQTPYYGTVEWKIPCYVMKFSGDVVNPFLLIDGNLDETIEKQIKRLGNTAKIVHRVVIQQIFYIENNQITAFKGNTFLGRVDITGL